MPISRAIWSLLGNSQRLDGGAMFGNAPKVLWQRWATPDEDNRIPLACRCLLVRERDLGPSGEIESTRWILFETGIGAFFPEKLRTRFGVVESEHVLLDSLATLGLSHKDIDVVVLSHLHFDHAGGLLRAHSEEQDGQGQDGQGQNKALLFDRATFVIGREAFERNKNPHPRDRASFIAELPRLLEASGRLELVDRDGKSPTLTDAYAFHHSEGHTPGLMLTELPSTEGPIVFAADLIPGAAWVHLPITMGYDRFPERVIEEKKRLLEDLLARGGRLFFTHDPDIALAKVVQNERGRYGTSETVTACEALELNGVWS